MIDVRYVLCMRMFPAQKKIVEACVIFAFHTHLRNNYVSSRANDTSTHSHREKEREGERYRFSERYALTQFAILARTHERIRFKPRYVMCCCCVVCTDTHYLIHNKSALACTQCECVCVCVDDGLVFGTTTLRALVSSRAIIIMIARSRHMFVKSPPRAAKL